MGYPYNDVEELVQKYLKEAHNRDMTIKEIQQQPWHEVVGVWWRAKVYFKVPGWYASEADVPDPPPDRYNIYLGKGKIMMYSKPWGEWIAQENSIEYYK